VSPQGISDDNSNPVILPQDTEGDNSNSILLTINPTTNPDVSAAPMEDQANSQ